MLADRIVVLDRGRVVRQGPPAETITDAMLGEVIATRLGAVPAPGIPFVLPRTMTPAPREV
jgi:iron complex transport system ATP-binding protein